VGRFNVIYAINAFAWFSMAPRLQYLEAAKRIPVYPKKYPESKSHGCDQSSGNFSLMELLDRIIS
jgi:hypothetical protein